MSVIAQNRSLRGLGVSGFFRDIAKTVGQYRLYRTTLVELQSLSDHELSDLGLSRSALRSVAYNSVYNA